MAVAQWRQMRQMPHLLNGKCNLLKAIKIFFFQNLSKFTPFASLYSDPAYGRGQTYYFPLSHCHYTICSALYQYNTQNQCIFTT